MHKEFHTSQGMKPEHAARVELRAAQNYKKTLDPGHAENLRLVERLISGLKDAEKGDPRALLVLDREHGLSRVRDAMNSILGQAESLRHHANHARETVEAEIAAEAQKAKQREAEAREAAEAEAAQREAERREAGRIRALLAKHPEKPSEAGSGGS